MRFSKWAAVLGTFGVAGALVVACDKGPASALDAIACERAYSVCPGSSVVSSKDYTDCARSLDGRCGTTMRQYIQCIRGKCDDAGAVDRSANQGQCAIVLNAYNDCANTDAGGEAVEAGSGANVDPLPSTGSPSDGGVSDAQP